MDKTIVAIDPGKSGGIAWGHFNTGFKSIEGCCKMPVTTKDLITTLEGVLPAYKEGVCVYMERVGGYISPRKGKDGKPSKVPGANSPMFNFGRNFGICEGIIQTLGYRLELVTPQKWIKALGLGKKGKRTTTEWKNHLKAMAQRLYPSIKVTHAVQDALLILEYARRLV